MKKFASAAAGIFLVICFFSLSETVAGLSIQFSPPWTASSPGELYGWLGTTFLLLPAGFLIALSCAGPLLDAIQRVRGTLVKDTTDRQVLIVFGIFGTGLFMVLNKVVMLGYPFTDDEWFIRYGGQLIASGRIAEPVPEYLQAVPSLFLYLNDGMVTSFDYLGGQVIWAIAEITYTETTIFAFFAALALVGVVSCTQSCLGRSWALVAGLLFLASPMALLLSTTSHAHVVSRGTFAIALALWCIDQKEHSFARALAMGLAVGFAWMTRIPEITMLWTPFAGMMFYEVLRKRESSISRLLAFSIGFGICAALTSAHAWAITDSLVPPRFAANELENASYYGHGAFEFLTNFDVFWNRLGANFSYNVFMLGIGLLGIPGVLLVGLGWDASRFTKLLTASVLTSLLLTFLHDNHGLHVVGPIHYSEAAVPLLIISLHGLQKCVHFLSAQEKPEPGYRLMTAAVLGTIISLSISNFWYGSALREQALIHDSIYSRFESEKFNNSIVVVPSYPDVFWGKPMDRKKVGTWVLSWRPISPGAEDRVIYAQGNKHIIKLFEALPNRPVFVLAFPEGGGEPEIVTLQEQIERNEGRRDQQVEPSEPPPKSQRFPN